MVTRQNNYFHNIILLCCSIAITLLLLNATIFAYKHFMKEDRWAERIKLAKELGIPFDDRPKIQVLDDFRSQGIEVYPIITPKFLLDSIPDRRFLPLSTISNKVLVLNNEGGTYELFTTDEHGFRNPPGSWSKQADILLVGDSFAMGENVPEGADLRSQLAANGKHVITIGMSANGPVLELAGLMEYGRYLKPKIVLWLYYEGNDLLDLTENSKYSILNDYLKGNFSQDLLHRQDEVDKVVLDYYDKVRIEGQNHPRKKNIDYYFYIFERLISLNELRKMLNITWRKPPSLPMLETVLQKAQNYTAEWGGQLYFVYLPRWERYAHKLDDRSLYKSEVLAMVRKLGLPVIDFHETLKQQGDPLNYFPLKYFGHYNEAGYRLLAATIMSALQKDAPAYSQRR